MLEYMYVAVVIFETFLLYYVRWYLLVGSGFEADV